MIIDVHTHTPSHYKNIHKSEEQYDTKMRPDRPIKMTNSVEEYLQDMLPVNIAIVFGIARHPLKNDSLDHLNFVHDVNDRTAEVVSLGSGKLIGFMSVHPDSDGVLDEVYRCKSDLNLRGIKLGPNYQNFDPLGLNAKSLYAYAEKNNIPIIFHQGTAPMANSPLRYSYPIYMDEIALLFPDLKIVMAHMGHPWHEDCIAVIRKHKNVYADISGQFYRPWSAYNGFRLAFEWNVMHKLLFASDWPVTTPSETIAFLNGLPSYCRKYNLPVIPFSEINGIMNRNSLELLEIDL